MLGPYSMSLGVADNAERTHQRPKMYQRSDLEGYAGPLSSTPRLLVKEVVKSSTIVTDKQRQAENKGERVEEGAKKDEGRK